MTDIIWLVSTCVIIAAVLAVRAIFGKKMSAGLRYALWGLVLLRLLVPGTVFKSPVSVSSAMQRAQVTRDLETVRDVSAIARTDSGAVIGELRRPASQAQLPGGEHITPEFPAETNAHQNDNAPASQSAMTNEGAKPAAHTAVILNEATPERFERMQKTLKARDILNIIWYTGMGLAALYFIAANLRFYLKLRARRVRLDTEAPCPVYSAEGLSSSCLFLNSIYISKDNAEDEEKLRYVLAHELAHRRHGDGIFALLRTAALILHWYNPLVWAAAFISRRDSELFADAAAIKSLGEEHREDYGRTLIELSSRPSIYAPIACAATMMTGGKRELKSRITHIARDRRMSFAVAAIVLALALAAVGCTFAGGLPGEDAGSKPGPAEAQTTEQPSEEPTAEPTEAVKETPAVDENEKACLDIARGIAEGICREHGITMDLENGTIKKSRGTGDYSVVFANYFEGTENASEAIYFTFDGDISDPRIKSCWFEYFDLPELDYEKLNSERQHLEPSNHSRVYKIADIEDNLGAPMTPDGIAEKLGAYDLAAMFGLMGEDNYLFCTDSAVVRLETVESSDDTGRYNVTVAVRPANEKAFQAGFADVIGRLWNAVPAELSYYPVEPVTDHSFDYCYTINYVMQVKKTDDGSAFKIDYGYTWESFSESTEAPVVHVDRVPASLPAVIYHSISRNFVYEPDEPFTADSTWGTVYYITENGDLWAKGSNRNYQIGNGSTTDVAEQQFIMSGVHSLKAGDGRVFALLSDGRLLSWGVMDPFHGQKEPYGFTAPTVILENVADYDLEFALTESGELWSIENCENGVLTPARLMEGVASFTSYGQDGYALTPDNRLYKVSWDYTTALEGKKSDSWEKALLGGGVAKTIPMGYMPYVITTDDKLCTYTTGNPSRPYQLRVIMENVRSAHSALYAGIFVIRKDGSLWKCSNYEEGSGEPQKLLDNVKSVVAQSAMGEDLGVDYAFAIKNDNTLWAMGSNWFGELGAAEEADTTSFVMVAEDVEKVYTDGFSTYIIKTDGSLWATGYNGETDSAFGIGVSPDDARLGDGTRQTHYGFVRIADGVASVTQCCHWMIFNDSDGTDSTCTVSRTFILKNDGTVWGWGYNKDGAVKSGADEYILSPVRVMSPDVN